MTWSLLYRRVAETGPASVAPYAIYLLGVNPPPEATDADLAVFNEFYTNVHMPEVAERRHALRAVRYELLDEIRPPYQGAPQFLAVYEVDEAGASNRRHIGPPYTSGPDVWQRHKTPWRLWYRRLPTEDVALLTSFRLHRSRPRRSRPRSRAATQPVHVSLMMSATGRIPSMRADD